MDIIGLSQSDAIAWYGTDRAQVEEEEERGLIKDLQEVRPTRCRVGSITHQTPALSSAYAHYST